MNEEKFNKLLKSIEWSEQQLEFSRKKRIEFLKQYVGVHSFEHGAEKEVPVNFIALDVQVISRQLTPKAPRVLLSTKDISLQPVAANFEIILNEITEEINLVSTLRKWVLETLFSPFGVLKIGIDEDDETFVDNVFYDDYFCDMSANTESKIDYEGNTYWMDFDTIKEKYPDIELKPDDYTTINQNGQEKAEGISICSTAEVYKDKIRLRDVWLPSEKLFITYAVTSKKKLEEKEWKGPEPYIKLWYLDVPGNNLPLPVVSLIYDLHLLSNSLFRKLGRGAEAQKSVLGFDGVDDEGVKSLQATADGGGIKYTGKEPTKLDVGGIDPKTLAFYLQCKELQNYFAGNIDTTGGLAVAANTLGQEQLISQAASSQLRDMADKTIEGIRKVFQAIAHYEWSSKKKRSTQKNVPILNIKIPIEWNSDSKKGNFEDYDIKIDEYTMQENSPQIRLQKMSLFMQQFVIPYIANIQQDGGSINYQKVIRRAAKLLDESELSDIVEFVDNYSNQQNNMPKNNPQVQSPQQPQLQGGQQPQGGISKAGSDRALSQLLLGGNPGE